MEDTNEPKNKLSVLKPVEKGVDVFRNALAGSLPSVLDAAAGVLRQSAEMDRERLELKKKEFEAESSYRKSRMELEVELERMRQKGETLRACIKEGLGRFFRGLGGGSGTGRLRGLGLFGTARCRAAGGRTLGRGGGAFRASRGGSRAA